MTKQDVKKLHQFFVKSAERDWSTFQSLKKLKRYDAALFFLHLAIEKHIKALYIKGTGLHPPLSHDLVFLIGRCSVEVSEQVVGLLRVISTFNIQTRYENEKFDFYKLATKAYVSEWKKKGEMLIKWIGDQ